jgi:hypothetical protein
MENERAKTNIFNQRKGYAIRYQPDKADAFYHHYSRDTENRLI